MADVCTFEKIRAIILSDIDNVKEEDITPEKRLRDLGADFSISLMVSNDIQDKLRVDSPFNPEWFMNQTLANTTAYIDQLLAEKAQREGLDG